MKTRRGGLSFRKSSSPRRPRTLVDLLQRDIDLAADDAGPDWPTVVEDTVLRQDMQWVEESLSAKVPENSQQPAHSRR